MRRHWVIAAPGSILFTAAIVWAVAHWIYHAPLLESETSRFSMAQRDAERRYNEWCNELPHYITPRLCAYYQLYPERFKPTGKGEEIEIEGFVEFVKADEFLQGSRRCKIRRGRIRDPWGDPVHFVQDLNMDGFIDARGQRREVFDQAVYTDVGERIEFTNEHRFGVCKHNVKGIEDRPWDSIFVLSYHQAKWRH